MSLRAWLGRLAVVAALAACGGSDGVGSGGTGAAIHAGTVSGFGSVLVDGETYDDGPGAVAERADGSSEPAALRIGHRVELALGSGVDDVRAIQLTAEVRGPVDAVGADALQVLGQRVLVNTNARSGPRTQFGGAARLDDLAVGDSVEVHGFRRRIDGAWVVQATRIERRSAAGGWLVAGLVEALDTAGGGPRFRIAGLRVDAADAVLVPAGQGLADGQRVTVWGGTLGGTAAEPVLSAARVRIAQRTGGGGIEAAIAGGIGTVDAGAGRFDLGGIRVDYGGANVVPPVASVAEGLYARVQGRWSDDGSRFVASRVILRGVDDTPAAEVTGPVAGWDAARQRFTVRDVPVDASAATLSGCPAEGLADGLRVQVRGELGDDGVVAATIRCLGN